ncbi:hypothetical protein [Thalassobius sp. I31.1]|uniref:hypothetical protein n=1 Tax=Thalassobius sp. I31.1 TaxID=2109912 RepID=UPI000D1ADBD7|nr:hypothetical protein [Thalassobius sp. I31.1]
MTVKPIKAFHAVVPGSAYPASFGPDDELEANSVAAQAALDLGCLNASDTDIVREALGLDEDQTSAADKAAADKAAADKAAADKAAADKAAADKAKAAEK